MQHTVRVLKRGNVIIYNSNMKIDYMVKILMLMKWWFVTLSGYLHLINRHARNEIMGFCFLSTFLEKKNSLFILQNNMTLKIQKRKGKELTNKHKAIKIFMWQLTVKYKIPYRVENEFGNCFFLRCLSNSQLLKYYSVY